MAEWICFKCMGEHETQEQINECSMRFVEELRKITPERMIELLDIAMAMPPLVPETSSE